MKNTGIFFLAIITFSLVLSCKKSGLLSRKDDYIIFGEFHGFCGGNKCVNLYELTRTELLEDTLDIYPSIYFASTFVKCKFSTNRSDKYKIARALVDSIPEALLNDPTQVFGSPDNLDQGGFYLEVKKKGLHRFWFFDTYTQTLPNEYLGFHKTLSAILGELR